MVVMTGLPRTALTGTTGALGGAVAALLAGHDLPTRLLVRDPARAPRLPGAEVVGFAGYGDHASSLAALDGVETLFMVSGSESADRLAQHLAFVDAAVEAGVQRVVYTSFVGAGPGATFTLARDHGATEDRLRACGEEHGLAWTFLRDSFYLDVLPLFVGDDAALRGPAGDGRVAAVARADVAACAAAVLRDPLPHAGATYDLTGPEAITLAEAARTIGAHQGREVAYVDETLEEAHASRAEYGVPDWQVEAWVSTYTAIASGELAAVSDDVRRLTGRPARDLSWVLEHPTT